MRFLTSARGCNLADVSRASREALCANIEGQLHIVFTSRVYAEIMLHAKALIIGLALTTGIGFMPAALSAAKQAPVVNISATADQTFSPSTITLHRGVPITLRFASTGGVHGIASPDLGIPATMILPDKPVSFALTPKKAGTYVLPCTIVCGAHHADMHLTVNVKP
jgi:heme/copper-type cytochrome/quinol oxidase subunit 2